MFIKDLKWYSKNKINITLIDLVYIYILYLEPRQLFLYIGYKILINKYKLLTKMFK